MLSWRTLALAILTFGSTDLHLVVARSSAKEIVRRADDAISAEPTSKRATRVLFHFHLKVFSPTGLESFLTIAVGPRRALSAGLRCKIQYLIFGLGGFRGA